MSAESSDRVRDLFRLALEHSPGTRKEFLRAECGEDHSLYDEVCSLLDVHGENETGVAEPDVDPLAGRRLGAYDVVRLIASGGMGRVYLGRRADGAFSRDVAVKVIDPRVESPELIIRFEQERRILGSLRHPCIAEMFDAGRTDQGQLYLVMEYIDGYPLNEFCDRRSLSLRERIGLFARVCEAVGAAHRSLIVHRDLKPGNILVDSTGVPKLLDFGIAKPLTRSGIASDPTHPLLRRATPAYASPEQLQGLAAHTSMDIFSLGVVFHELITGHRPWPVEPDDVTGTGIGRYLKPSAALARRLKDGGADARTWSSGGVFVVKPREIEGDLDAIVEKATHDDAHRRYASVDLLIRDLQAFLAGEPVSARPTSTSLRFRKLLQRNRTLSAAVFMAVVALVVTVATVARLWFVAARDRDRANAQVDNLKTLAAATFAIDKSLADLAGATVPRRELVGAISRYLSQVQIGDDQALALETAEGYRRLGDIQGNPNVPNLGDSSAAVGSYEAALALLEPLGSSARRAETVAVAMATTHAAIADVFAAQLSFRSARTHYQEALSLLGELPPETQKQPSHQVLVAGIYRPIGDLARATGDLPGAFDAFNKALAIDLANAMRFPNAPEYRRLLALTYMRIAGIRAAQGMLPDARTSYERVTEVLQGLVDQGEAGVGLQREVAIGRARLGFVLEAQGDRAGRESVRSAVASLRALYAADPVDARLRRDLMATLVQLGDIILGDDRGAALAVYREARQIALTLTSGDIEGSPAYRNLAVIERKLDDLARGTSPPDLQLFTIVSGRRILMQTGDPVPRIRTRVSVSATTTTGWSRYLLVFGAEGAAQLLDESALEQSGWVVSAAGPPPAQTILLVASPRPLSEGDRRQLLADVETISARTVDWDSQIVWTPTIETIETTTTARGFENQLWVPMLRERFARLGSVAITGRTFPIASDTTD